MFTFSQYLKEGSDYSLYHSTFTAAAQAAKNLAKKRGFEIDDDDWFNQVSTGPKKPGKGKTNRYIVKVTKGGKETKKRLAFQVYGMDSGKYELNAYVESTQIEEATDLDEAKQYVVIDKRGKVVSSRPMSTSAALDHYDSLGGNAKGYKVVATGDKRIKEFTDLEEIVGTVALGTVVAVGTLAAMLGVVKGAKYMASKLGDAAQSYVDKKDLAAFRALKKSKYQDEIESIAAKFDGDTTLQSMYKSLPDWSSGTNKAAFVNNADRKKKMDQIAKHIKLKLDAEESKAFAAISKVLRSKNEEAEMEESTDLEEAFSRLPGNVINNELYVVNRDLQQFASNQLNGDDVNVKLLSKIIKDLQGIKKEVKKFNDAKDVPLSYQYKSKK